MTSEEFAKAFYDEKENLLDSYFERKPNPFQDLDLKSQVGQLIKSLNLEKDKHDILFQIVDGALTDTLYTILLGLDGCATIGNSLQQMYDLKDEDGNQLTGELEGHAYDFFHGQKT